MKGKVGHTEFLQAKAKVRAAGMIAILPVPREAYIMGDLTASFLRYRFGGLKLWGLFSNFTVC